MELKITSMTPADRLYAYNQSSQLEGQTGCIGHLRGDFGGGQEFYTSWFDHRSEYKTDEFKSEFDEVVNTLREKGGLLCTRDSMTRFCYVLVLGAHTLITKTLLIWALFFAVASWSVWEIFVAIICGCMACVVTAAGYRMCRKGHIALPLLWAAGILAVILLVRQWAAVLAVATASLAVAALYLAFADAYDFYSAAVSKKTVRHKGRAGSVFVYLTRYLMANKSYLINTVGLCAIACFLPLLFGEFQGLNMFPMAVLLAIGGAVVLIAVFLAVFPILKTSPREILSRMEG